MPKVKFGQMRRRLNNASEHILLNKESLARLHKDQEAEAQEDRKKLLEQHPELTDDDVDAFIAQANSCSDFRIWTEKQYLATEAKRHVEIHSSCRSSHERQKSKSQEK